MTNAQPANPTPPLYLDTSRPFTERVEDLLARLTLKEKISQMTNQAAAIPRLGIPAYNFWSEGLHGVGRNGRATIFPQAIGMAATWDQALIQQVGSAIGDEARAKHHAAVQRNGFSSIYQGLTIWSPNVNIFRDPRWGRGQETWGEDPYLTGEMGAAFVRGLQGDHPKYLKVAACAKHFAVHSGPEESRHSFNAEVSPRDLHATYLPAFKKLVTARVEAVMGAYNRVNGEACCASQTLLVDTLRTDWGFQGHVVSDCWALSDIHQGHHITADAVESAALALKAGCDLSCMCTYDRLGEAVARGLITEADIDRSLSRTLLTRFKLGMFDPPAEVPFTTISLEVVASPLHRRLAYQAAVESIVLLKNKKNVLPIGSQVRSLFITGPNAASLDVLLGNYYGLSTSMTTLLEGIAGAATEGMRIDYRPGCTLTHPAENPINWSLDDAAQADLTLACMGLSPLLEGEEGESILSARKGDRADLSLPAVQIDFLKALVKKGAKVVLILSGGSPLALGGLEDMLEAILYIWYPGQEGGKAVADVLFGKAVPSGKLPLTFPASLDQLPPFDDYSMEGRTYRYSRAEPLYPFGFGLSYARFTYRDLLLSKDSISAGDALNIQFTVANTGAVEAEEVAQIYLSGPEASTSTPLSSLLGFRRVQLAPGESKRVSFTIEPESMQQAGEDGQFCLEQGRFRITVGGCSPGRRGIALGAPEPLVADYYVV